MENVSPRLKIWQRFTAQTVKWSRTITGSPERKGLKKAKENALFFDFKIINKYKKVI